MDQDFTTVTELAGDDVTQAQVKRLCDRYYWAGSYCSGKDVLEAACGTGQGLRYLQKHSRKLLAGDYSDAILKIAQSHYRSRMPISRFDAQHIPFKDKSFDIVILFEAIYYIPDPKKFVMECCRILRPQGTILLSSTNKDLHDFHPSPFSSKSYGVLELNDLFPSSDFTVTFYGSSPTEHYSLRHKIFRPLKKIAVKYDLIPKTMDSKKWLKRIVFGKLVPMPYEISEHTASYSAPLELTAVARDTVHGTIFCAATKKL